MQLWPACRALSLYELATEVVLGDAGIVHAHYNAKPAHASLFQKGVHTGDPSPLQNRKKHDCKRIIVH